MNCKKNFAANHAFTLVELLVVISIIALLLGILLPGLRKARELATATICISNTRQWGIGATMFVLQNDGAYPWEGNETDNMSQNFHSDLWWANAIPKMLGQPPYRQISETAIANKSYVPLPPAKNSIFICPGSKFPAGLTYDAVNFFDGASGYLYQLFFCYVWNSEMNNGSTSSASDDIANVKLDKIKSPSKTVLMLEMRTTNEELDPSDYSYYKNRDLLGRHRGDWKRVARRHFNGLNMTFCDSHTARVKYDWATTNAQGSRNPDRGGDWNKSDLIWNPFGPSVK